MLKPALIFAVILLVLGGTAFCPRAEAATVSGSASIWTYLRDDSVDHAMVVPTLSLTLREFAGSAVRFETSLRGFSDIRNGESQDEQLRVLRGILIYSPEKSPWELRVGQQWLTEGVGRGNVLGPWVKRKFGSRSSLTVYGGARLVNSLRLDEKNANNGYSAGIHARTGLGIFRLGASYFYVGKSSDLLFSAAGVEADVKPHRNLLARARLDMNLEQSSIETGQFLANWTPGRRVQVTGEFRLQAPRIYEDSYFTRFLEESAATYVRGGARWQFSKENYLQAYGITLITEEGDPLYKVRAALGQKYSEIGYTHWLSTLDGEMDGVYAQFRTDVVMYQQRVGEVFGGFDLARGSNSDLRPKTDSHSMYFGLTVNPVAALSLSATGEQIQDYDSEREWRGIFSVGYRFTSPRPEAHP